MPKSSPSHAPNGHRFRRKGRGLGGIVKAFFGGNAALTIVILLLIIVFLLREGVGFFPAYRKELQNYRNSGLEFVDIARKDLSAHEQMGSLLNRAYYAQVNSSCLTEMIRLQESMLIVNYIEEATAPAHDALVRVRETDPTSPTPPELLEKLASKYRSMLEVAVSGNYGDGYPPTPHLSNEEVQLLCGQLAARDPLSKEDPAFAVEIQAALKAKQEVASIPLTSLREMIDTFQNSSSALDALVFETSEVVKRTKESVVLHQIEINKRVSLLEASQTAKPDLRAQLEADAATAVTTEPVDLTTAMAPVLARLPEFKAANVEMIKGLNDISSRLPATLGDEKANRYLKVFRAAVPAMEEETADTVGKLEAWRADVPVGLGETISGFITGRDWITGGEWQDFYGIMPLFVGSLMISVIALAIAIPFGVGAAIYTNQLAGRKQQRFVKPTIEFLQAIPSVVLGFVGIAVLGTLLQEVSTWDSLSWIPGFPIQQRLNMFTAGCLLGLMAVPTIFTLSEDAINNVPAAFAEASDALGASKLQTIFRVIVPAAVSGILAAVLLGLGRVIGETMVVLLVAGNRIQIPDFSDGIGSVFQPAHTLTGIIAQELGEVPFGSVHYRALFVVGILLFVIVLAINWTAQRLLRRFRISQH